MKNLAISFGIGAVLSRAFTSNTSAASKAIEKIEKKIGVLNNKTKNVSLLKKYGNELLSINQGINERKNKIEQLKKAMKQEGADTKAITGKIKSLGKEISNLTKKYDTQKDRTKKLRAQLRDEGIDVNNLTKEYSKLENQKRRLEKLKNTQTKLNTTGQLFIDKGKKAMGTGMALTGVVLGAVKTAMDSESAYADVEKQFNFNNKEESKAFRTKLEKLITEKKIAIDLNELYGAAASAGQSGISKEESIDYIELATKTGIAFNIARDEAANTMFKMKNAFSLPLPRLKILIDQINYLGNTTGANAAEISEFVNRVGNIGIGAGFKTSEIAAIGATLVEQGMAPEVAATGAKKLMGALTKGMAASKQQKQVYKMLGLDPVQLAKEAQKDAPKALKKLLSSIGNLEKHKQGAVMTQLFGEEGLRGAAGLLNNIEKLEKNFNAMNDENAYTGSAEKEFQTRQNTFENKLLVLKQVWGLNIRNFAESLLPTLSEITQSVTGILNKILKFQNENPKLFSMIAKTILGIGVALTTVGAGVATFGLALKGVSAGISAITFLASPVGLVIAGIVALVAAGYALYKNWDTVKEKAVQLKNKIGELIDKYWFLLGPLGAVLKGGKELYNNWDAVKEKAKELGAKAYELADKYWFLLGPLGLLFKAGQKLYKNWDEIKVKAGELKDKVVDFITNAVQNWDIFKEKTMSILKIPFNWLDEKIEKLKEKFSGIIDLYNDVKNFDISGKISSGIDWVKDKIPGFASGGIVNSPTFAMVGEGNYPESIIPHDNSAKTLALWEQTGRIIGAQDTTSSTESAINITYSPVINGAGNGNIEQILQKDKQNFYKYFEEWIKKYDREKFRRGNGR